MSHAGEALEPSETLLRVILSSRALKHLPDAFMLRPIERDSGLSVFYGCSYAQCRAQFRTTYGIARLTVGSVSELGLQVIPDAPIPNTPNHANIRGIPYKEDDPAKAEWYASRLAAAATLVDTGKQVREEK